jgi:hypothetical protein
MNSRTKGHSFERAVANILKVLFPKAKRGLSQTRVGNEVSDVEGTPYWVECKRHKKCNIQEAFTQAETDRDDRNPVVISKDDHGPILVTMSIDTFLILSQYYVIKDSGRC